MPNIYALLAIAGLVAFIAFDKYRDAEKICETRIEKINNDSQSQVKTANQAADAVPPADDLAALCLRDKFCRSDE